jgi:hypothetical protein
MKIAPPRCAPAAATRTSGRLCMMRRHMDARTKWVIAILLFLVLVLLVIGGIMAIASPPDACC